MKAIFWKTLGGLDPVYYLRHLCFGLIFPGLLYLANKERAAPWQVYVYAVSCTLLYPYARFTYEGIVHFVVGQNVFYLNTWVFLFWKVATMTACWVFAPVVAPFGLLYLYVHHTRIEATEDHRRNG